MSVININNENFKKEVLNADKTVIVDFYANWCGPCKMMSPILDKIESVHGSEVKICKLNVDENQDLAIKYQVMSIPTLIFFRNGSIVNTLVGLRSEEEILRAI